MEELRRLQPLTLAGISVVMLHDLRRIHGEQGMECWARAVAENAVMGPEYVRTLEALRRARWPAHTFTAYRGDEFVRWDFYNRYFNG